MPASITRGTASIAFTYGAGHQRIKQVKGANAETIYYFGGGGTEQITAGSSTRWVDYISVGGRLIGSLTRTQGDALINSTPAYFHTDHLGSLERITDQQGNTTETLDFDAWGKRRYPSGAFDPNGNITSSARRGFTGHEQLDTVGLVHMNGRVYDPLLARFISADTVIQAPLNLQNYNRYSYVLNNPLSYTDPSGHMFKFLKKAFKAIGKFFKGFAKFVFSRQALGIVVGVDLMWATGGLAGFGLAALVTDLGVVASGALAGAAAGAITTGTLKGAVFGAISGAIGGYVFGPAEIGSGLGADLMRGGIMGMTEGTIAAAQGGDFRSGFMSAAFASVAGAQVGAEISVDDITGQLISRAAVGGTASVIGGGKFANGAYSAAFQYVVRSGFKRAVASAGVPRATASAGTSGTGNSTWPSNGGPPLADLDNEAVTWLARLRGGPIAVFLATLFSPTEMGDGSFVNQRGFNDIRAYLESIGHYETYNSAALQRLQLGNMTSQDLNFYAHELHEARLVANGASIESAHLETLRVQGIPYGPGYQAQLYHPEVIRAFPDAFNEATKIAAGIR